MPYSFPYPNMIERPTARLDRLPRLFQGWSAIILSSNGLHAQYHDLVPG